MGAAWWTGRRPGVTAARRSGQRVRETAAARVTVYTRVGCPACAQAEDDVARICGELGETWRAVDVDADPGPARRVRRPGPGDRHRRPRARVLEGRGAAVPHGARRLRPLTRPPTPCPQTGRPDPAPRPAPPDVPKAAFGASSEPKPLSLHPRGSGSRAGPRRGWASRRWPSPSGPGTSPPRWSPPPPRRRWRSPPPWSGSPRCRWSSSRPRRSAPRTSRCCSRGSASCSPAWPPSPGSPRGGRPWPAVAVVVRARAARRRRGVDRTVVRPARPAPAARGDGRRGVGGPVAAPAAAPRRGAAPSRRIPGHATPPARRRRRPVTPGASRAAVSSAAPPRSAPSAPPRSWRAGPASCSAAGSATPAPR